MMHYIITFKIIPVPADSNTLRQGLTQREEQDLITFFIFLNQLH